MGEFHKSRAWRRLAKDHKTLQCHCGSKTDIESAHYLPQKRFPLMRLWRINLYYSCKKCNGKLGDKIYWSIRAIQLLGVYMIIRGIECLLLAFLIALVYKDISAGGWDTSFTSQILIGAWEQAEELRGQPIP